MRCAFPFDRVAKAINAVYSAFLGLLTGVIVVVVAANVFARYVLNSSIGWADELSRFLFIWIVFYGAVLAYVKNEHIGLDFIVNRFPEKVRAFVLLLAEVGVFIVTVMLTYYGWVVSKSAINFSPALNIRMGVIYSAIPISAFLMSLVALAKIARRISGISSGSGKSN